MIDFQKVQKEYPLAYKLFNDYFIRNYSSPSIAILPNFDRALGNVKIPFSSEILYNFFDKLGFYLGTENFDAGEFVYVIQIFEVIEGSEGAYLDLDYHLNLIEKSSDESINGFYDTRKEMEIAGFENMFEHLELHLQSGVKLPNLYENE